MIVSARWFWSCERGRSEMVGKGRKKEGKTNPLHVHFKGTRIRR